MKIVIKGLVIIAFLAAGMSLFSSGQYDMDPNERIFDVGDFHSISNSIPADLVIRLNESRRVEARGDKGQLDQLKVYVRNGELIIRRKIRFFSLKRLRGVQFTISMPGSEIRSLNLSSSGNAEVLGDLKALKTQLRTSSSGSIKAQGDVEYLQITSSSSGDISYSGVNREMNIWLSASGEADVDVRAMKVEASISSSGNIYITGEAVETELRLSSGGEFIGPGFITENADITISSSANAELTILKKLEASLSSGGNLYYRGNPVMESIRTSSSGEIIKKD
ncbi:head GIN domain-containing protein [Spirochaeta isovalerica]|uniref:Putative auto-transporter adhesin head GIN domain-containing protein n=1 Tax=Spirochaeta isovalerica TaxID=150 RepID=A0A841R7R0_9SPIO|nr:head GIN domain-containing protein [Spirochaeta isovalerica]MBB6479893.1 hypothetical protein [Spirochaeta isovalerica]